MADVRASAWPGNLVGFLRHRRPNHIFPRCVVLSQYRNCRTVYRSDGTRNERRSDWPLSGGVRDAVLVRGDVIPLRKMAGKKGATTRTRRVRRLLAPVCGSVRCDSVGMAVNDNVRFRTLHD